MTSHIVRTVKGYQMYVLRVNLSIPCLFISSRWQNGGGLQIEHKADKNLQVITVACFALRNLCLRLQLLLHSQSDLVCTTTSIYCHLVLRTCTYMAFCNWRKNRVHGVSYSDGKHHMLERGREAYNE